jgi:hypothetical protein
VSYEQGVHLVEVPGGEEFEVEAKRWCRPTERMDLDKAD